MAGIKSRLYHPLYFLSSLGAGGLSVAFWKFADVTQKSWLTSSGEIFFYSLAVVLFVVNLPYWIRDLHAPGAFFKITLPSEYGKSTSESPIAASPVVSTGWMAMPASLVMLLNSSFAILPEFFHMPISKAAAYGFWIWLIAYIITFVFAFQILFNTFTNTTKLETFHFGLFLQPLTFGLIAIPGVSMAGILNGIIGDMALLLGLTAYVIGGLVGSLALIFIFQRFLTHGLPEPAVAPTTLLMMPSITVYSVFMLRLLHFIAHHGLTIPPVIYKIMIFTAVGFMGASATVGLVVLYIYFKDRVPFNPSWWSFVCPFVALSVLNSIAFQFGGKQALFIFSSGLSLTVVTLIYLYVGVKTIVVLKQAEKR